jgi:hypothetical protein
MAEYQQRDNSGVLFKNDKKTKDTDPNAKGEAMVNGVMCWVSAWTNKDKNGNPYQKLSFTPKDDRPAQAKPAQQPAPEFDDDVPF